MRNKSMNAAQSGAKAQGKKRTTGKGMADD